MKYGFLGAIFIITLIFSFATIYIITSFEPLWYFELLMLFSLWIALLSFFAFLFYFVGFLLVKLKIYLKTAGKKNIDRTERLVAEGQLKLYLSRRTFRNQLMKGYLIATAIIILILLQRFFGFI